MKRIFLFGLFSLLLMNAYAQPRPNRRPPPPPPPGDDQEMFERRGPRMQGEDRKERKERIEVFKIQFITEKLELTPNEAESFWPVYEEYNKAVKEIAKTKSEDEILFQEAILVARKKYKTDLKPILKSDERVNEALKIEREFLNKIRFEMNKRRGF
jgi:hypothetical protein